MRKRLVNPEAVVKKSKKGAIRAEVAAIMKRYQAKVAPILDDNETTATQKLQRINEIVIE